MQGRCSVARNFCCVFGKVPVGAGLAFAHKYRKDGSVAFAIYGDGAANQGEPFVLADSMPQQPSRPTKELRHCILEEQCAATIAGVVAPIQSTFCDRKHNTQKVSIAPLQGRSSRPSTLQRCGTCPAFLWWRTTTTAWAPPRRAPPSRRSTTPAATTCQVRC